MKYFVWLYLVLFPLSFSACSHYSLRHLASVQTQATVPTADWAGVLILPKPDERTGDGGVWFQVFEAPAESQAFIGKKIWLKWDERDAKESEAYHSRFMDVHFCEEARKEMTRKSQRVILRARVDNWKAVSPLESLAAGHNIDDMVATFSADQIHVADEKTLEANTEPTIVSGPRESVVIFKQQLTKTRFIVETLAEPKQRFPVELILREDEITPNHEKIDTSQFLLSQLNKTGWIIQGFQKDPYFEASAVAPYSLFKFDPSQYKLSSNAKRFFKKDLWHLDTALGRVQKLALANTDINYKEGDEFLVFDAFGNHDHEGQILGMVTGHAALGWANIRRHPQTGDLILKTYYWQIYYNSPRGIMSAKYDTLSYNGDLFHIESFFRPITDVFVPISFLEGGSHAWSLYGRPFLERSMADSLHATRLGYGYGFVMETVASSCVHDMGNIVVSTIEEIINKLPKDDPDHAKYSIIKKGFGKRVDIPKLFRTCDKVERWDGLPEGFQNESLVIPRSFQDAAVKSLLRVGAPLMASKTLLITQDATHLVPVEPFSIHLRDIFMLGIPARLQGH